MHSATLEVLLFLKRVCRPAKNIEAGGSFSLDSQDGDGYIVKIHFDDFAQSLLLCLLSFQLGNSTRETDDVISKKAIKTGATD